MRYSFFHAADLHLGAASEGVMKGAPTVVRDAVETSTYRAFENLIRDAEKERPAFVLFPGDLYNSADQNLRARLAFRDGVIRLETAGIPSYVIRGNHDPLVEDPLKLPESCHIFEAKPGEAKTVVYRGEPIAQIYGESYPTLRVPKNLAAKYPQVIHGEGGLLQIAMLHGNLIGEKSLGSDEKNPSDYAPFALNDLEQRGYNYWALGHVHAHRVLLSGISWAIYTGSLQGVSPREQGAKGYVAVRCDSDRVTEVEFREADVLRWAERWIDLSGLSTHNQVQAAVDTDVRKVLEEAGGRPVVARLHLTGLTDLDAWLRQEDFGAQIEALQVTYGAESPFFWIERCSVETQPAIDWAAVRASQSVQAFLLELADGENPEFLAALPLKLKEVAGRTRFEPPTDEELAIALHDGAMRAVTLMNPGAEK